MSNAQRFLDGYLEAWTTNDPDSIRALFAPDATYRGAPRHLPPFEGVDAIVAHWLEEQDAPGTWTYEGGVAQESGNAALIHGVTSYSDGPKSGVYDNTWLVRFDDDGRATEFQDWWFERRG
ncbi:hypothetical protein GCM10009775_36940 [Microbacterium aoyamense]|uniref:SnoaL-like domain-containing protein n=1 Tax=Microbacterium aoyamense TaxID=344166 RepID=A0ABP5BDR2_9MICO|nr:nuclear transport factor 2 family protein [Microbacterium aoyamense]